MWALIQIRSFVASGGVCAERRLFLLSPCNIQKQTFNSRTAATEAAFAAAAASFLQGGKMALLQLFREGKSRAESELAHAPSCTAPLRVPRWMPPLEARWRGSSSALKPRLILPALSDPPLFCNKIPLIFLAVGEPDLFSMSK